VLLTDLEEAQNAADADGSTLVGSTLVTVDSAGLSPLGRQLQKPLIGV
jgi:hypothetical protein